MGLLVVGAGGVDDPAEGAPESSPVGEALAEGSAAADPAPPGRRASGVPETAGPGADEPPGRADPSGVDRVPPSLP